MIRDAAQAAAQPVNKTAVVPIPVKAAVSEPNAKCIQQPAPAAAKAPKCLSNPAVIARSTAKIVSPAKDGINSSRI